MLDLPLSSGKYSVVVWVLAPTIEFNQIVGSLILSGQFYSEGTPMH